SLPATPRPSRGGDGRPPAPHNRKLSPKAVGSAACNRPDVPMLPSWATVPRRRETPAMPKGAEPELMDKWKTADAVETYGVRHWGKGYFGVNKAGHVTVQPSQRA